MENAFNRTSKFGSSLQRAMGCIHDGELLLVPETRLSEQ